MRNLVAKHNTAESCWVVLYGKVYDVSALCFMLNLVEGVFETKEEEETVNEIRIERIVN